jgi:hypothetical protein
VSRPPENAIPIFSPLGTAPRIVAKLLSKSPDDT